MDNLLEVKLPNGKKVLITRLQDSRFNYVKNSNHIKVENSISSPECTNDVIVDDTIISDENVYSVAKLDNEGTMVLLKVRLEMEEIFLNPGCKKVRLWEKISQHMKVHGYDINPIDCQTKYRRMLQTYRTNKEKLIKYPEKPKTNWQFFDMFDDVFGSRCSFVTSETPFSTSFMNESDIIEFQDTNEIKISDMAVLKDDDPGSKIWTDKMRLLLIYTMVGTKQHFDDPACDENELWEQIAEIMNNAGHNVNSIDCCNTYKKMFHFYKLNKERVVKNPETKINWQFFDIFDTCYGTKYFGVVSKNSLSTSMDESNNHQSDEVNLDNAITSSTKVVSKSLKWNVDTIQLLLHLRFGMEEDFNEPSCKKVVLWEKIAQTMKEHNHCVNSTDCHNKYRNLLQTYRINKEKQLKHPDDTVISWDFFDQFDHVFGYKCYLSGSDNLVMDECCTEKIRRMGDAKWNIENTTFLLNLRLGMQEAFMNPRCQKVKLWEIISKKMKEHDYTVSGDDCNSKYRNLLQTYKVNKEKQLKNSNDAKITWDFFNMFDQVFGPTKLYSKSDGVESSGDESEQMDASPKRKKGEMSRQRYLYLKIKYLEETTKKKDQRWKEKKELEEKKIEAIYNLTQVMLGNSRKRRWTELSESE